MKFKDVLKEKNIFAYIDIGDYFYLPDEKIVYKKIKPIYSDSIVCDDPRHNCIQSDGIPDWLNPQKEVILVDYKKLKKLIKERGQKDILIFDKYKNGIFDDGNNWIVAVAAIGILFIILYLAG